MIKLQSPQKTGFTLIEIMVAVSIFVIVAFIVTSTLMAILDAGRRANKIRLIVDNMNFALDSMTYKLKFGDPPNLSGNTLDFIDRETQHISYCRGDISVDGSTIGTIFKCDNTFNCGNFNGCKPIITPEIDVGKLQFKLTGVNSKKIVILVQAVARVKGGDTSLDFQTAVSQAQSQ